MSETEEPTLSIKQRVAVTKRPAGRSAIMYQRWKDLLFLHWSVDSGMIQRRLPPGLHVDTYESKAYLGIVPFLMKNIRPRFLPAVPGLSHFPELNLRTYVHDDQGRPGVWFFSLDASQKIAVSIAQTFFSLPYVHAQLKATAGDSDEVDFSCQRKGETAQRFRYTGSKPLDKAMPDSLEFFLVERYHLFSYNADKQRLYIGQIHHEPYTLFKPRVSEYSTRLFELNGFPAPNRPPDHQLYAPGVDVTVFPIKRIGK